MSRLYTYGPEHQYNAYGMEQCEEKLLIAYQDDIDRFIPPTQHWKPRFIDDFYQAGKGVGEKVIDAINTIRKRFDAKLFDCHLTETQMFDYGKMTDKATKARLRCDMLAEYKALDQEGQKLWKIEAREEIATLPPPHFTHREFLNKTLRPVNAVSRIEPAKNFLPKPAPLPPLQKTRAIQLLKLTKNPDMVTKILDKLTTEDCISIAESGEITDETIIEKIVERTLAG